VLRRLDIAYPNTFDDLWRWYGRWTEGDMPDWRLEGPYMKNCNCDPGCPCDFNADPTHHACEGVASGASIRRNASFR
jgi:hypothetical protein